MKTYLAIPESKRQCLANFPAASLPLMPHFYI
jgi:hypothetical protein